MEYAQKGDLLRYFIHSARETNTVIEEAEIWRICKAVAKGLSILHSRNIVHKDIKPQNILVMSDLSVKVSAYSQAQILFVDCRHGYISVGC